MAQFSQEYILKVVTELTNATQNIDKLVALLKLVDKEVLVDIALSDNVDKVNITIEDIIKNLGLSGERAKVFSKALSGVGNILIGAKGNFNDIERIVSVWKDAIPGIKDYIKNAREAAATGLIDPKQLNFVNEIDSEINNIISSMSGLRDQALRAFNPDNLDEFQSLLFQISQGSNSLFTFFDRLQSSVNLSNLTAPFKEIQSSLLLLSRSTNADEFFERLNQVTGSLNEEIATLNQRAQELRSRGFADKKDVDEFKNITARLKQIENVFTAIDTKRRDLSQGRNNLFIEPGSEKAFSEVFNTLEEGVKKTRAQVNGLNQDFKNTLKGNVSANNTADALGDIQKNISARELLLDKLRENAAALREERQLRRDLARSNKPDDELIVDVTRNRKKIEDLVDEQKRLKDSLLGTREAGGRLGDELRALEDEFKRNERVSDDLAARFKKLFGSDLGGSTDVERRANAIKLIREQQDKLSRSIGRYTTESDKARKANESLERSFDRARRGTHDFDFFLGIAVEKIIRYRIAFLSMQAAVEQFKRTLTVPKEIESAFVKVGKVLDANADTIKELRSQAFLLARTFGTEIKDVIDIMQIWAQQGKTINEIFALTQSVLVGMKAANLDASEAVELLTSATKIYNISAEDSVKVFDKILNVERQFAVTTEDLAQSLKILGTGAEEFGVSIDSLFGDITAIVQVTRKSGQQVANALKTVFARFAQDDTVSALRDLGIAIFDINGNLKPLDGVLDELATRWNTLTDAQQINIARLVGGLRHYNQFLILMDQYDVKLKAARISQETQAFSVNAASRELATLNNQLTRIRVSFDQFLLTIGESKGGLFTFTRNVADAFEAISAFAKNNEQATKSVLGAVSGIISLGSAFLAAKTAIIATNIGVSFLSRGLAGNSGSILEKFIALETSVNTFSKKTSVSFGKSAKALAQLNNLTEGQISKLALQALIQGKVNKEGIISLKIAGQKIPFIANETRAILTEAEAYNLLAAAQTKANAASIASLAGLAKIGRGIRALVGVIGSFAKGNIVAIAISLGLLFGPQIIKWISRVTGLSKSIKETSDSLVKLKESSTQAARASLDLSQTLNEIAKRKATLVGVFANYINELSTATEGSTDYVIALSGIRALIDQINRLGISGLEFIRKEDIKDVNDARALFKALVDDSNKSIEEANKQQDKANKDIVVNIEILKKQQKQLEKVRPALDKAKDATIELRDASAKFDDKQLKATKDLIKLLPKQKELLDALANPRLDQGEGGLAVLKNALEGTQKTIEDLRTKSGDSVDSFIASFERQKAAVEEFNQSIQSLTPEDRKKFFGDFITLSGQLDGLLGSIIDDLSEFKEKGKEFDTSKFTLLNQLFTALNASQAETLTTIQDSSNAIDEFGENLAKNRKLQADNLSLTIKEEQKLIDKISESTAEATVFARTIREDVKNSIEDALRVGQSPDFLETFIGRTSEAIKKSRDLRIEAEREQEKAAVEAEIKQRKVLEFRKRLLEEIVPIYNKIKVAQNQIASQNLTPDEQARGISNPEILDDKTKNRIIELQAELDGLTETFAGLGNSDEVVNTLEQISKAFKDQSLSAESLTAIINTLSDAEQKDALTTQEALKQTLAFLKERELLLNNDLEPMRQAAVLEKQRLDIIKKQAIIQRDRLGFEDKLLESITEQFDINKDSVKDIFDDINFKLEKRLGLEERVTSLLGGNSDAYKEIGRFQTLILNRSTSLAEVQTELRKLAEKIGGQFEQSANVLNDQLSKEEELNKERQNQLRIQGIINRYITQISEKSQTQADLEERIFNIRSSIVGLTQTENKAIRFGVVKEENIRKIREDQYDTLIDIVKIQEKSGIRSKEEADALINRFKVMKSGQGELLDQVKEYEIRFKLINKELDSANKRVQDLANAFASVPQSFNEQLVSRFQDISEVENDIASQELLIQELRKKQLSITEDNTDEQKKIKEEIADAQKELDNLNKSADKLKNTGQLIRDVFSGFGEDLSNLIIDANVDQVRGGLADFFTDTSFGKVVSDAFLSPSERAAKQMATVFEEEGQVLSDKLASVLKEADLPTRIEQALANGAAPFTELKQAITEFSDQLLSTSSPLNGNIQQPSALPSRQASQIVDVVRNVQVKQGTDQTEFTGPPEFTDGLSNVGKATNNLSKKQGLLISATTLLTSTIARQIVLQQGGTSTGANFGNVLGSIAGEGLATAVSSTLLSAIIPGVGGVLGTLIGGLFTSRKAQPEIPDVKPFEDNTKALKETTDAIRTLTTQFEDLRDQLINAPASFIAPPSQTIQGFGNVGGTTQRGQAGVTQAQGVTIQFNIQGGFDQSAADKVISEIDKIYNKQSRLDSSNSRLLR